jgi:zinc protease
MIRHIIAHDFHRARRVSTLAAALVAGAAAIGNAQQSLKSSFDRTVIPTPGAQPALHIPTWTKTTLNNGAQLVVSVRHGLPLVSFQVNFIGGADQYEPADTPGLAAFTAANLLEATTHHTGDELSNDLQLLGTNLGPSIGAESGRIAFTSTRDKFAPSLALLADVLENATFPQESLDRYRARVLVALTQARDRTPSIANVVFPKVVYTTAHPYGRTLTDASARAITRDDLVNFYKAYFQPGHAVIIVVGDVDAADVARTIEQALAGWHAGGTAPAFDYPPLPAPKPTTIYLVDKPGAAQSTFAVGEAGPPRDTPDYYAVRMMNEMLGVLFQSRLNHEIREVKGYSYGVSSNFAFGRGPGAFRAGGDIVTAKTDSALIEFMNELRDIRGPRPPSDDELTQAKASLVQSLPETFSSVEGTDAAVSSIYTQGLPDDYYTRFIAGVNAVTKEDVVRVAQKYIDPAHLAIVIVGDRAKVQAPLEATKIAPVVLLDVNGNPE